MLDDHGESTAKHWMRAKMLKFKENYRPAYYGTWRKKSSIIKPRAPLNKDTDIFDYEVGEKKLHFNRFLCDNFVEMAIFLRMGYYTLNLIYRMFD